MQITDVDIWNYWKSLYPEIKQQEELSSILETASEFRPGEIQEFMEKQKDHPIVSMEKVLGQEKNEKCSRLFAQVCQKDIRYVMFQYLINFYFEALYQGVCAREEVEDRDQMAEDMMSAICERLLEISIRSVVLEINVEREDGRLKGENGNQRFSYYFKMRWNDPGYAKSFYEEYTHLYCLSHQIIRQYLAYIGEMIDHVRDKHSGLGNLMSDRKIPGKIRSIQCGLGDSHKKGKTVAVITFDGGEKVVYKPRGMGAEQGFNKYIAWMNQHLSQEKRLYEMKVLDGGDYGFAEYIVHEECSSKKEPGLFYYRSGVLMAMLYTLNAKDMHHENMIAKGGYPVMVDLEALFHSNLRYKGKTKERTAYEKTLEQLEDSVYSIGLLPMPVVNPYKKGEAVDIGGFSGEQEQESPFPVYMLSGKDTDEIKIVKGKGSIASQKNIPAYQGKQQESGWYQADIKQGFNDGYHYIMAKKEEAAGCLGQWFLNTQTRVILRPTYLYSQLGFTGMHPDFMRQRVHRYVLFHRFSYQMKEKELVRSEVKDMMNLDIPYFSIDIKSGVLKNSEDKMWKFSFEKVPLAAARDKIRCMSEKDFHFQSHIIENAFLVKEEEEYRDYWKTRANWSNGRTEGLDYRDLAERMGKMLLDTAYHGRCEGKEELCWLNFVPVGKEHINYQYAPVESDLYSGNSGIALFFLYLGMVTENPVYTQASINAMNSVIRRMKQIKEDASYLTGPYNGLSGYLYAAEKMYQVTGRKEYLKIVENGLDLLEKIYHRDTNFDIISGSAGVIKVLMSFYNGLQDEDIVKKITTLLRKTADHLLAHAEPAGNGKIAWKSGISDCFYTGYAHGSAGIEEALAGANTILKDTRIDQAVRASMRYTDSMWEKSWENWRTIRGRDGYANAWCHGAPGIMYSRAKTAILTQREEQEREWIERGIRAVMKQGLGNNICYCHGDIGNIELLKATAELMGRRDLAQLCDNTYDTLVKSMESYVKEKEMLPAGMMLGVSGIGYSLLRRADSRVPSVLILE